MTPKQAALVGGALLVGVVIGFVALLDNPNAAPLLTLLGVLLGASIAAASSSLRAAEERHHQLRLAALERRLQAHQEAYTYWRRLCSSFHRDAEQDIVLRCQDWWVENCLYLDQDARQAFYLAYQAVGTMRVLSEPDAKTKKELWSDLVRAGPIIEGAVGLPSIAMPEEELRKPVGTQTTGS